MRQSTQVKVKCSTTSNLLAGRGDNQQLERLASFQMCLRLQLRQCCDCVWAMHVLPALATTSSTTCPSVGQVCHTWLRHQALGQVDELRC
jgi:hypothetical protein